MQLKKKIVAVLSALALIASLSMLTACQASGKSDSEAAPVVKFYSIATDVNFGPFEFTDSNGKLAGIDIEILAAIAKDQGFEYRMIPLGFGAALQSAQSGQADGIIAAMSITDEHKQAYDFSLPYLDSGVVMGVAAENTEILGYPSLGGKTVAVKTDSEGAVFAESIKDQFGFSVVAFADSASMYESVQMGSSQALFEDYHALEYSISQGIGLKIAGDIERSSSYGFAVIKDKNPELLGMFNAGLTNITANGTLQEIIDRYIKK